MKNKFKRLISSLLIMAFLVSAMSVFAVASDDEVTEENPVKVIFNRGFDDGWEYNNGAAAADGSAVHKFSLGEEPTATGANHYLDMTVNGEHNATNCYYQIQGTTTDVSGVSGFVVEFDLRSDGMERTTALTLLYLRIAGLSNQDIGLFQRTAAGNLQFIWGKSVSLGEMPEQWVHLATKFEVDEEAGTITATTFMDGVEVASGVKSFTTDLYVSFMRFQAHSKNTGCADQDNLCLDNIKYYVGTSEFTELNEKDYGTAVDTTKPKTVILEGATNDDYEGKTDAEYLGESYIMKVGTHRALQAGEKINIFEGALAGKYGAPRVIDGVIYVPLIPLLEHMGANYSMAGSNSIDIAIANRNPLTGAVTTGVTTLYLGRDEAVVAREVVKLAGAPGVVHTGLYYTDDFGEEVEATFISVAMDDIEKLFPGWYITYDDMGLIILSQGDNIINRDTGLNKMIELMQAFVYDDPLADDILAEFTVATNNFDHPFLLGKEDDFVFLRSVYNKEYLNEDGTANEEFLAEHELTLENLDMLWTRLNQLVCTGVQTYVNYLIPDDYEVDGDPNYFFSKTAGLYSATKYTPEYMYDSEGNFIFPYDENVRGAGKIVFQPQFTAKADYTGVKMWDLVIDDYVIVNSYYSNDAKRNYVYNPTTGGYEKVPEGAGMFDKVSYAFVDLYEPLRNYDFNNLTGEYEYVGQGYGKYDYIGDDSITGEPIYLELRQPLNNYARKDRESGTLYDFAYPFTPYMNFDVDPTDPETYLELNVENPTLCQDCHVDHFGYDHGSRCGSGGAASDAQSLMLVYWMTGNLNYVLLAYDLLDIMGSWQHWGPAHALNFAEASYEFAVALDWMYDIVIELSAQGYTNFKGEPMDIKVLQQHLWEKGSGEDYVMAILKGTTAYLRDNIDEPGIIPNQSSYYVDDKNNWGNVVNANTAVAAICLLDYTDTLTADTHFSQVYSKNGVKLPIGRSYQSLCAEILEIKFWCLHYYAAWSYVPDGVYSESPGYWSYGTNEMMNLVMTLYSNLGHTYTLMDAPGYEKTFMYVASMESNLKDNIFVNFNYNDGGMGASATGYFFIAALALEQPELISIRLSHLEKNKTRTYCDIFYFKEALHYLNSQGDSGEVELDNEFCGKTLDLFVTRSSWDEEKPLFAGIMGGQASMNHGHLDTGSWVYYNDGYCWVIDPGSESYNIYKDTDYPGSGDWVASTKTMKLHFRYRYYRLSSEGHNTLILTGHQDTLPYGQSGQGTTYAHMMEIGDSGDYYYSDENGSYVMYDMQPVYKSLSGAQYTNYARRGMLLTNGRQTLVIQDEIEFANMEKFAWCAHADLKGGYHPVDVKISDDMKSVYLLTDKAGTSTVCRLTIVMEYEDNRYGFEVRRTDPLTGETAGVYLLDSTLPFDSHLEFGGDDQNARTTLRNIIITPKNGATATTVRSVNMAIVMETFSDLPTAQSAPVSYKYTPMEKWETYEEGKYTGQVTNDDPGMRKQPTANDFGTLIGYAGLIETETLFNQLYEVTNVYSILTDTTWIIKQLGGAHTFSGINQTSALYVNEVVAKYEQYVGLMNTKLDNAASIIDKIT